MLRAWGALALLLTAGVAAAYTPPPPPSQWVTDRAGFISPATREQLNARLRQFERDTGHQIIVWIGETTGDTTIEDWAARTFDAWDIGRKGEDDGVALFIFAQDRKLRIEVGYGLEGVLPDAIANRIIQERAVPLLRQGQNDAAVASAISGILEAIGGETSPPPGAVTPRPQPRGGAGPPSLGQLILFGIIGIIFLILFITNPRLALFLMFSMMSGGRGGGFGGGGGGGGFRGGGGRSGGGGASGSW